jgi:hypothetical protein
MFFTVLPRELYPETQITANKIKNLVNQKVEILLSGFYWGWISSLKSELFTIITTGSSLVRDVGESTLMRCYLKGTNSVC